MYTSRSFQSSYPQPALARASASAVGRVLDDRRRNSRGIACGDDARLACGGSTARQEKNSFEPMNTGQYPPRSRLLRPRPRSRRLALNANLLENRRKGRQSSYQRQGVTETRPSSAMRISTKVEAVLNTGCRCDPDSSPFLQPTSMESTQPRLLPPKYSHRRHHST